MTRWRRSRAGATGAVAAPTPPGASPAAPTARVPARPRSPAGARYWSRDPDLEVRYGLRLAAGYAWRLVAVGVAGYGIAVVLRKIQLVVVAVLLGLVISALLRPVADRLSRLLPRRAAVALSLVLGLALVAGVLAFILESVAGQFSALAARFGDGVAEIVRWLRNGPLHGSADQLGAVAAPLRSWFDGLEAALVGQAPGQATAVLQVLAALALAAFCSAFFIAGGDRMWAWCLRQLPRTARERVDGAGRAAWETFAGYTRGIVIVAVTNAALAGVALLTLRVPLALPLALLVLFATFIPMVGAPLALGVATIVALSARGPVVAVLVLLLAAVTWALEAHVLQPLVSSRAVAVHPLVVAVSVGCGALLAGVVGAVLAVPLVSVAWAVHRRLRPPDEQDTAAPA